MSKSINFNVVNAASAGIDIGASQIFVSTDGENVIVFDTFTADYRECARTLKEHKIKRVAMEATGVYWIALHEILEKSGFEVCLVNPKETKQVKGRKSDVADCRWIQKLFSAGLLHQSYIPAGKLKELRMLVRERMDTIETGSMFVNKMQKALELMNIKLKEVISQIHGYSGINMIQSIIDGERDPHKLLQLCHTSIQKKKANLVLKALEGNYNQTWLFLLEQNLKRWQSNEEEILIIDVKIGQLLEELEDGKPNLPQTIKPKHIRHHKPAIEDLHQKMLNIYGVEANCLPGINDYTLLRLLGEVGTDMSKFPTIKAFVSWCGLAPGMNQSGRWKKRSTTKNKSKAGQIFRELAQSIISSQKIAIGAFMRKLRGRKGPAVAIKAGARKIAEAYYNLLTKGVAYVEQGVEQYQKQIRDRDLRNLKVLATKYDMKIVEN